MTRAVGSRFGRLVVKEYLGYSSGWNRLVRCVCDCGNEKVTHLHNVERGLTKSCGCLHKEIASQANTKHGHSKRGKWTPEYRAWSCMLTRCLNPNARMYPRYGGRGITVCNRWMTYENFYQDMGARPTSSHSLDRIDNEGHYEPGNCRWATRKEQARNKSSNTWLEVNGRRMILVEACELYGISHSRVRGRIKAGWTVHDAVTIPVKEISRIQPTERTKP